MCWEYSCIYSECSISFCFQCIEVLSQYNSTCMMRKGKWWYTRFSVCIFLSLAVPCESDLSECCPRNWLTGSQTHRSLRVFVCAATERREKRSYSWANWKLHATSGKLNGFFFWLLEQTDVDPGLWFWFFWKIMFLIVRRKQSFADLLGGPRKWN